jgi:hypothetical protein
MQFDVEGSHSHRGFSPVIAAGLLNMKNRFNGFFRSLGESR